MTARWRTPDLERAARRPGSARAHVLGLERVDAADAWASLVKDSGGMMDLTLGDNR